LQSDNKTLPLTQCRADIFNFDSLYSSSPSNKDSVIFFSDDDFGAFGLVPFCPPVLP